MKLCGYRWFGRNDRGGKLGIVGFNFRIWRFGFFRKQQITLFCLDFGPFFVIVAN